MRCRRMGFASYLPHEVLIPIQLDRRVTDLACIVVIIITRGNKIDPRHEISNNVVCATSKGSDQPAHTRSLIRAFAIRLNIL